MPTVLSTKQLPTSLFWWPSFKKEAAFAKALSTKLANLK